MKESSDCFKKRINLAKTSKGEQGEKIQVTTKQSFIKTKQRFTKEKKSKRQILSVECIGNIV